MLPSIDAKSFSQFVLELPGFESRGEFEALGTEHGPDTLAHLTAVIERKLLPKEEACRQWTNAIGIAYVDVLASAISEEATRAIPLDIAQKTQSIGLYIIDGVLTVAMSDPCDTLLVRRLEKITQLPISAVFCLPCEIASAISIQYSTEKSLTESLAELERNNLLAQPELATERLAELAESESLIRVLDELLFLALRERATDIHVEPQEGQSRLRFRVDGNMREVLQFSRKLHRAIISRLKILCNLNLAESRFPQDGRFSINVGTKQANFRFSSLPGIYGEKAVVRILASTGKKAMVTLERMMMSQDILHPFRQLVQSANGILFVTGPTLSGKTTTLYAALHELNDPKISISTIEDPVEIPLAGITQSQVNSHIDLSFATLLRSLLRQDPDVLLVGEIRDLETAKVATEAALTGHLVLATLHSNTATQAVTRLMEIGVDPYMVAPSIIGVLAQRLAAKICEKCKEAYYPSREVLMKYFEPAGLEEVPFYRGRGCPHCRGTGYYGRIAFHELVLVTEEMRQLISERRSTREITRAATRAGYRPLRYDGLKKVLLGLTTIEEIEQSTTPEWCI